MTRAAIRSQGRRAGLMVLAGPILAGAVVVLAGWFAADAWPPSQAITLVNWLAQVFVIATGVCASRTSRSTCGSPSTTIAYLPSSESQLCTKPSFPFKALS